MLDKKEFIMLLFLFFIEEKRKSNQKEKTLFSLPRASSGLHPRGKGFRLMSKFIKRISGFRVKP